MNLWNWRSLSNEAFRAPIRFLPSHLMLALALVIAPVLVGTVHVATTLILTVLCLAGLWTWAVQPQRPADEQLWLDPLSAALLLLLAWVAATMIPLPDGVLQTLSPRLADVLDDPRLVDIAGDRLAYAPGGAAWELLKLSGAISALVLTFQLAKHPGQSSRIVGFLALSATVVMIVSIAQTTSRTHDILWLYRPISPHTAIGQALPVGFRTPFVNPNHAAQFLEIGGLASLGMGLWASKSRLRWAWIGSGLLALGGVFVSASLGGWVAVGAGLAFLATLWLSRLARATWLLRFVIPVAALALGFFAIGGLVRAAHGQGDLPGYWHTFQYSEGKSKADPWPATVRMAEDHRWVGVGRGSFRDAYSRYQQRGLTATYTHAENEYLQLFAELGTPCAALLLLAFVVTWGLALGRWEGQPALAGTLAATLAVAIHSFAEFGLEFGGVGLPFLVAMGICASHAWVFKTRRQTSPARRIVLAIVPAAALLAAPVALRNGDYHQVVRSIDAADPAGDPTPVMRFVSWRPASPDVAMAIAAYHARRGDWNASLRWLSRVMFLAPEDPSPHLAAAPLLAEAGRTGQALLELQTALERSGGDRTATLEILYELTDDIPQIEKVLGSRPDLLCEYAEYVLRQEPTSPVPRALLGRIPPEDADLPSVLHAKAEVLRRDGDLEGAAASMEQVLLAAPGDVRTIRILSSIRSEQGQHEEARGLLVAALAEDPENASLYLELGAVEASAGNDGAARRNLRRARSLANPAAISLQMQIELAEGDILWRQGDLYSARDRYLEAVKLRPGDHRARLKLARVYRELGQTEAALREYRRVQLRSRDTAWLEDEIQELEASRPTP